MPPTTAPPWARTGNSCFLSPGNICNSFSAAVWYVLDFVSLTKLRQSLDARLERQITTLGQLGTRIHATGRGGAADPAVAELWSSLVLGATTDRAATLGRLQADVEALLIAARRRDALAAFDAGFTQDLDALATGTDNTLSLRRDLIRLRAPHQLPGGADPLQRRPPERRGGAARIEHISRVQAHAQWKRVQRAAGEVDDDDAFRATLTCWPARACA